MNNIEAHISESIRMALEELRLDREYNIARVSVAEDGQWCARLERKDKSFEGISICVPGSQSHTGKNVELFKKKISRYLRLSKG